MTKRVMDLKRGDEAVLKGAHGDRRFIVGEVRVNRESGNVTIVEIEGTFREGGHRTGWMDVRTCVPYEKGMNLIPHRRWEMPTQAPSTTVTAIVGREDHSGEGDEMSKKSKRAGKTTRKDKAHRKPGARGVTLTPRRTYTIFDKPVTAVLRRLGAEGFTVKQATAIMAHFKIECSPITIGAEIGGGKNGKRGLPATMTREELSKCRAIAKEVTEDTKATAKPARKKKATKLKSAKKPKATKRAAKAKVQKAA